MGRWQSGQLRRSVKPLPFGFISSNLILPTIWKVMLDGDSSCLLSSLYSYWVCGSIPLLSAMKHAIIQFTVHLGITFGILMLISMISFILSYIAWVIDNGYKLNIIILDSKCNRITFINNYYEKWNSFLIWCFIGSVIFGVIAYSEGWVSGLNQWS